MGSRLLLSAAAVLLAFALPATSHAADSDSGAHAKKHHYTHHYRSEGKHQIGGHRYWYQTESFPYNDQYSAPGHYNNQTFWDRVQSGSNYPVGR
jgi:hypothetical protein